MSRATRIAQCLTAALAVALPLQAQPPDPQQAQQELSRTDKPIYKKLEFDQGGTLLLTKHVGVVFGGIKQGSGMAVGPAVSHKFGDGSYVQLKGAYSIRDFKLLQLRYDSKPLLGGKSIFTTRVRWQDAPELHLYALGPDSPNVRATYAEQKTEWAGVLSMMVASATTIAAGIGVERYLTSGSGMEPESGLVQFPAPLPGAGARPVYAHTYLNAAYDTRLSPTFSRTGRVLQAALHAYHDVSGDLGSFRRIELAAEQLIPTFKYDGLTAGVPRGALSLEARAWMSQSGGERDVPFFLMPTLGGGTFLRGYSSYRFRDRHAMLLRAEYAYAVHKMVDLAGVYEAGTVAPRIGDFRLRGMAQSTGVGLRVHSKTSGLFRADVAYGRDGFQFSVGVAKGM